jgi:Ca2+-binding EF-hand superfamily protein
MPERGETLRNSCAHAALDFEAHDVDRDGCLSFDEFLHVLPRATIQRRTKRDLKMLFDAVDLHGNGTIKGAEFFLFFLRITQKRLGATLEEAFLKFDTSASGSLDKVEFAEAMDAFGFGQAANEIFELLDSNDSGEISYRELEETAPKYNTTCVAPPQTPRFSELGSLACARRLLRKDARVVRLPLTTHHLGVELFPTCP